MDKLRNKGSGASWFLTIFGGIFLAVGLFVGGLQTKSIFQSINAQNWVDTPAVVTQAQLDVSYDSDGNTYRATGEYEYQWQGDTYASDRLFFGTGSDSQDKFHRGIVKTLKSKQRSGERLTVKVNPNNPGQAVAFPQIRWGMTAMMSVFTLLFGGVGAGIIAMGQYAKRLGRRESLREAQSPDEPWLWRDEWQTPTIKNDSKLAFYMALGFAAFWNLISWPGVFLAWDEIFEDGNYMALLIFLFPLIGLGLLIWCWRSYQQWRRFGRTELVMETFPAPLGHALLAKLRIFSAPPQEVEFHVKLSLIREETRGSGEDRRTVENMIWQDEQLIPASKGRYGPVYELPLRFALPEDQPASSIDRSGDPYIWRITVKAEAGYLDMDQRFEVPVFDPQKHRFKVPASARLMDGEAGSQFEYQGKWQRTGVIYSGDEGGHYYFFPAARHKGIAAITLFMGLIFGAVGIAPFFTDMSIFFALVFGLFALLLLFWSALMWLHKSAVDIADGILTIRRGFFGGRFKDFPIDDIKGLELDSTMSSGETKYYDIRVRLKSGDKQTAADHLIGRRDTLALMRKWESELGLASKG